MWDQDDVRDFQDMLAFQADVACNNLLLMHNLIDEQHGEVERRDRSCSSRAWLLRRPLFGHYEQLMVELREEDVYAFKNYIRMEPRMFQELLDRVAPRIETMYIWYKEAITPGMRLAITLRHIATGDSYRSLMYCF